MRSSTIRPTTSMGIISSGMIFVGSRTSKSKLVRLLFVERLNAKLPFGKGALGDGLIEVAAMKVWVRAVDLHRFIPDDRG